jgi:hypothetical protein
MSDEKDRFGDKLHDLEKVREDQWAREEDRRLLEKLRQSREEEHKRVEELRQRQSSDLHCLHCNAKLVPRAAAGVAMLACPNNHGAWLDAETLQHMTKV